MIKALIIGIVVNRTTIAFMDNTSLYRNGKRVQK